MAARLIETLRKQSGAHRFAVHAYCVLPGHFHLLVSGVDSASNLLAFVKNLKHTTSREYHREFSGTLWQKKFCDYILRSRDSAAGVVAYIWMNPIRKGLCRDPRAFPRSSSFVIDWRKTIAPAEDWTPYWKAVVLGQRLPKRWPRTGEAAKSQPGRVINPMNVASPNDATDTNQNAK